MSQVVGTIIGSSEIDIQFLGTLYDDDHSYEYGFTRQLNYPAIRCKETNKTFVIEDEELLELAKRAGIAKKG